MASKEAKLANELKQEALAQTLDTKMNCSVFTYALKEIIQLFVQHIIALDANTSSQDGADKDVIHELGAVFFGRTKVSFFMGYDSVQHVSLTPIWLQKLWDKFAQYKLADATVNWIKVVIEDDELTGIARDLGFPINPKERKFVAEFVTEPCDGPKDEDLLGGENALSAYLKDLIKRFRFRYETMNLKTLMTYEHYTSFPRGSPHIVYLVNWLPTIIDNKIAPPEIVMRLKTIIGNLARVKTYKKISEDKLELIDVK